MLHVIQGQDRKSMPDLMDQMHALRARSFKDRRGWRVEVRDGMEKDAFDDLDPVYILVTDGGAGQGGAEKLLASLRILPTTGPYMMSEVFPEVIGAQGLIRHPLIWESSRFCVDTKAAREFGPDTVNMATRSLLAGLFRTALGAGMINVVSVYDVFVERVLRRSGCIFERMGPLVEYDNRLRTTSGLFEVSQAAIDQIAGGLAPKNLELPVKADMPA